VNGTDRVIEKQLEAHLRKTPALGEGVYVATGAVVVGDVILGDHSSVWYHAVLRGDINRIAVGHHTNIQDNAVLHVTQDRPCVVGNWVTIGHGALVHACSIGDETLIGMGAVVLDGAVIGRNCLIGAGAVVTPKTTIPDGMLVLGAPAKPIRLLSAEERQELRQLAEEYARNAAYCLAHGLQMGAPRSAG
jgi:carbonic anhydrase/acetyltransferase-like protein (isoleucine patch superfamily)